MMTKRYGANNYHPIPVTITRAQGVYVWDTNDKIYLDCLGGYSSINQGHRHPEIIKAAKRQMDLVTLTTRAFDNDQMEPFLKTLCEFTEMEMALPMNTGAEAVETAIKMARKWAYTIKNIPDKHANIVVCSNNFHGRTTTIVGFSTNPQAYTHFGPYDRSFRIAEFGDIESLKMQMNSYTAAVMIEPIQGEGGILIPPEGYLTEVKALCKENNVLFILDEVQTGFGRTGKLFAWQHEGSDAKPDAIILGKALSGGVYPVSAVASSAEILGVFKPGDHGSTYGG